MSNPMMRFLQKAADSPELRRELVELAAKYGVDFSGGALSDAELGDVTGGLDTLNLQTQLAQQSQAAQLMSNISKQLHDTALGIIQNLKS